jgi:cytochrome c-type biogenesis protein CcmE
MNKSRKFAVGTALLVGSIAYLVYAGVQEASVYYLTIEEFASRQAELGQSEVRIAGRVEQGSIRRQTSASGTELEFVIAEPPREPGGSPPSSVTLPVRFRGVVPDMFGENRDVIVEGRYTGGLLEARSVMTSCPSKYEAGKDGPGEQAGREA